MRIIHISRYPVRPRLYCKFSATTVLVKMCLSRGVFATCACRTKERNKTSKRDLTCPSRRVSLRGLCVSLAFMGAWCVDTHTLPFRRYLRVQIHAVEIFQSLHRVSPLSDSHGRTNARRTDLLVFKRQERINCSFVCFL